MKSLSSYHAFCEALKMWKRYDGYRDWVGTPKQLIDAIGSYEVIRCAEKLELPGPVEVNEYLNAVQNLYPALVFVPVIKLGVIGHEQRWCISSQICSLNFRDPPPVSLAANTPPPFELEPVLVERPNRGELWARFAAARSGIAIVLMGDPRGNPSAYGAVDPKQAASYADSMLDEWDKRFGAKKNAEAHQ